MSKYTDLITNYHSLKPLYFQHIDLITRPFTDISVALNGMLNQFDLDKAVGEQLDIIGLWIGRQRTVSTPISNRGIRMASGLIRGAGRGRMTLIMAIPRWVMTPTDWCLKLKLPLTDGMGPSAVLRVCLI